jgi:hypothetical protein
MQQILNKHGLSVYVGMLDASKINQRMSQDFFHFILLFALLYFVLAFLATYSFGDRLSACCFERNMSLRVGVVDFQPIHVARAVLSCAALMSVSRPVRDPNFGSFGTTCYTQFRMICGEFNLAEDIGTTDRWS